MTRSARVWGRTSSGLRDVSLETDGAGRWRVDDVPAGHLDGCLDVDLESSSLTNAFPVHASGRGWPGWRGSRAYVARWI